MNKLLKSISKEEWIIGGAVALLFYVIFSNRKSSRATSKSSKSGSSRLVVDDPTLKRVDFPVDLEERFKQVAGSNYDRFIQDLNEIGLDKEIAIRQIWTESRFNPKATSPRGAKGLTQFIDSTWASYGGGGNPYSVADSLKAYPKLLKDLMAQFPNRIDLVLAGFNSGAYFRRPKKTGELVYFEAFKNKTPFSEYKNKIPKETQIYVASILRP
jgi:soluble lytic murein transglycosylase-like protein